MLRIEPGLTQYRSGGFVDLLPFSESLAPDGRLRLEDGFVFNTAGLSQVVPHALHTEIEGGPTLPLAPLPLYVLLKLVAFTDRKASKDLGSVLHCLEHYLEDDDQRYEVDHEGAGIPYDDTCAYMLGVDGRPFLDAPLRQTVTALLDRFDDPGADVVGIATSDKGQLYVDDEERTNPVPRRYARHAARA